MGSNDSISRQKVIVLLSGGVDSVTAFYAALKEHNVLCALSFHYGSKHNERELECARHHASLHEVRHETISLGFMDSLFRSDLLQSGGEIPTSRYTEENMKSTVVPFRNGIMLAIAAGLAESLGATGIVIGAHSGDHSIYTDCQPEYMAAMDGAVQAGTYEGSESCRHSWVWIRGGLSGWGVNWGWITAGRGPAIVVKRFNVVHAEPVLSGVRPLPRPDLQTLRSTLSNRDIVGSRRAQGGPQ